jgi:predicted amidohydrolase
MNWSAEHYRSEASFKAKIRSVMEQFREKTQDRNVETLIVFPEDVGTPLVLADAPARVFRAETLQGAIMRLTAYHIFRTAAYRMKYKVSWVRALALARAKTAARIYFETFSGIAKEYKAYIVAGSILLPDFRQLSEGMGRYTPKDGNVYNICFLFGPDGKILGSQKKVYLVPGLEDKAGFDICNGSMEELKVFDTPFGRLGIAVCLDGFQKDVIETLASKGAEILIQPSANSKPWTKAEQEGWMESVWKDMDTRLFRYALNPMMNGCLFDLCFEGQSSILKESDSSVSATGYKDLQSSSYFVEVAAAPDKQEILSIAISD